MVILVDSRNFEVLFAKQTSWQVGVAVKTADGYGGGWLNYYHAKRLYRKHTTAYQLCKCMHRRQAASKAMCMCP